MKIENKALYSLYRFAKEGEKTESMVSKSAGLYLEGFTGGVTVYAMNSNRVQRQTFTGDNKAAFFVYVGQWQKTGGESEVKELERQGKNSHFTESALSDMRGKFAELYKAETICEFTVNAKEFRHAVNAVDVINRGENRYNHRIVLSAHGGFLDIASWPDEDESAVWRLDGGIGAADGAIMVSKKYLDHAIKGGGEIKIAYRRHRRQNVLDVKTADGAEAVIADIEIDKERFMEVLEYEYRAPTAETAAEIKAITPPEVTPTAKTTKPERKQARRVPRPKRESGTWTYNRLGTKQTMVCRW